MIDRTQEDINQDQRLAKLEQGQRDLTHKVDSALDLIGNQTTIVGLQQKQLVVLKPLEALLEHIEAIKDFITNIRSIKRVKQ